MGDICPKSRDNQLGMHRIGDDLPKTCHIFGTEARPRRRLRSGEATFYRLLPRVECFFLGWIGR